MDSVEEADVVLQHYALVMREELVAHQVETVASAGLKDRRDLDEGADRGAGHKRTVERAGEVAKQGSSYRDAASKWDEALRSTFVDESGFALGKYRDAVDTFVTQTQAAAPSLLDYRI